MKISELKEKLKNKPQYFILVGAIVLMLIIAVFAIIFKGSGEIAISIETSLKEVLEVAEISTVEYTYNSIVEKKDDKNESMYYVKYKGTVKAGFDFDKLEVKKDETEENKLIIYIPEIKINSVSIDEDLEYIFTKEKYKTTNVHEMLQLCNDDLLNKANTSPTLMQMAKDGAEELIRGFTKPLEKEGYIVEMAHGIPEQEGK